MKLILLKKKLWTNKIIWKSKKKK